MGFPFRGGNADGNILDGAAVSCHGMSLKVRQYYIVIIVLKMASHIVFLQICTACHWQGHGTVLVHNVYIRDFCIFVVFRHLIVHSSICTGTSVCGIALHNSRVIKRLYQIPDQVCPQIIAARLPGRKLDCDVSFR